MKPFGWRGLTRTQWAVFATATLGYGLYYVCRLSLSVVKAPLVAEGVLTETQLGLVGSALFYVYAVGKLVNGFLADRVNLRLLFALGLLLSTAANLFLGWSSGYLWFLVLWAVNGWAQSMGAPSCVVGLTRWFERTRRGTFYGWWSSSHNIGEGLTFLVTAAVVAALGWRAGFMAAGLSGLVGVAMIWLWFPKSTGEASPADAKAEVASLQWQVLLNPVVWTIALASACMYVTRYAVNSWGMFFFEHAYHLSAVKAGGLVALNSVCGVLGTIASGWISDVVFRGDRFRPACWFGLLNTGCLALMLWGPRLWIVGAVAMVGFGLGIGALVCYLGGLMAVDSVPKHAAGAALGVVGVASYAGAGTQDILSGWLIGQSRTGEVDSASYDFTMVGLSWMAASVATVGFTLLARKLQQKRSVDDAS